MTDCDGVRQMSVGDKLKRHSIDFQKFKSQFSERFGVGSVDFLEHGALERRVVRNHSVYYVMMNHGRKIAEGGSENVRDTYTWNSVQEPSYILDINL